MIDFGAANDHNKHIRFLAASIGYLDRFWGVTIAVRLKLKSSAGTWGYVVGKQTAFNGWAIRFDFVNYGTKPEFFYRSVVGVWRWHRCTTALNLNEWYTLVFCWRGDAYGFWFIDGDLANQTNSGAPGDEIVAYALTTDFHICGQGGANLGAAVEMDNVIIIPGLRMRSTGTGYFAKDYHAGSIRPWALQNRWLRNRDADPGILGPWFWWSGEYVPGRNIVTHSKGGDEPGATPVGVPVTTKDYCDKPPWVFLDICGSPGPSSASSGATPPEEAKVGKMPAKMYAEVTERNRTFLGLKLDLPDDNDLGFSMAALPTGEREYAIKVKSWSSITRGISDKDYRLTPVETQVVVADPGRVLSKLFTGKLDGRVTGSPAEIRLVSPHVDPDSWMTVYEGELRRWQPRGNLPEITLYLGPNDKPLRSRNRLGFITRDIYPQVPGDVEGQPLQMIYGTFDSIIGGGPISCPKVQANGLRYEASVGMVTPLGAYVAGVMYDPRSGYKIERCNERGGRWFTEIVPVSDAGSSEITIDVEGAAPNVNSHEFDFPYTNWPEDWQYERPITNPAEQILHFLANFIYGFYEKDQWLAPATDMPIDVESFIDAASWFRVRGVKGRTMVYGNETGYQFINRWASKWRIPAFWNSEGKIAVRPDRFDVVRGAQTNLIDREHGVTNLVTINKDDALADEILVRHNYDWINEEYDDETRAKDLSRDYGITKDIDQDWSAV